MDDFGRTELHNAVINQEVEVVVELLKSDIDINIQDKSGWTALHFACQNYDFQIAKLLIDQQAHINLKDLNGNTPLFRATFNCKNNSGELIKLLIQNGADPDEQNNHGVSPFELANRIANYKVIQHFS